MKLNVILLSFLFSSTLLAAEKIRGDFVHEVTASLGVTSLSVTDLSESSGGTFSGSSINLGLDYPFYKNVSHAYFIKTSIPVISDSGTGLYSAIIGLNIFKNTLSGAYKVADGSSSLTVRPKWQFFWGPHVGTGLAVYKLDTAKKSDFSFLIGGQGGVVWQWKEKLALKGDLGLGKGFGINTSILSYFASLGLSYQMD